jgi:hypothetical protein
MSLIDDLKKLAGLKPRFSHIERELAEAYGLAPDALKAVRSAKLQRGTHWDLVKSLVTYSDLGKAALEVGLGIATEKNPADPAPPADPAAAAAPTPPDSAPNNPADPAAPKKFEPPKAGEVRTLVAVAKVRNRRMLKARDQDRVAWVRVKDSKNFRSGMELPARFISGEQWELEGRCPRWNGKF